jgi:hypothetical protein
MMASVPSGIKRNIFMKIIKHVKFRIPGTTVRNYMSVGLGTPCELLSKKHCPKYFSQQWTKSC